MTPETRAEIEKRATELVSDRKLMTLEKLAMKQGYEIGYSDGYYSRNREIEILINALTSICYPVTSTGDITPQIIEAQHLLNTLKK